MRNNNLFTYILYVSIAILVVIAGYKACEMKNKQAEQAKEEAELQEALRQYGYIETDTTQGGSSYESDSLSGVKKESEPIASKTPESKPVTETKTAPSSTVPAKTAPATSGAAPKTTPATTTTTITSKPAVSTKPAVSAKAPVSAGRYMVVTGAFKTIGNARDEMEKLVKAGYLNAEVKSLRSGWYHSIAMRSNDKGAAQKVADKLKVQYPSAYVKDSK